MSRNQRRNRRNKQSGSQNRKADTDHGNTSAPSDEAARYRSSTETKSSLRTTELIAYVGAVLAVIMTALSVDGDDQGGSDPFGSEAAMRYIAYLTIGYLVARGLAKSGSHENRIEHDMDDDAARTMPARAQEDNDNDNGNDERDGDVETTNSVGPSGGAQQAAADNDVRP